MDEGIFKGIAYYHGTVLTMTRIKSHQCVNGAIDDVCTGLLIHISRAIWG